MGQSSKKIKCILIAMIPLNLFAGFGFLAYEGTFTNSVAKIESLPMNLRDRPHISAQFVYTGTALNGSCTLEASNDGENYTSITSLISPIQPTGGNDIINKSDLAVKFVRAVCINTTANPVQMKIYLESK